jgi:hypothetical protein
VFRPISGAAVADLPVAIASGFADRPPGNQKIPTSWYVVNLAALICRRARRVLGFGI